MLDKINLSDKIISLEEYVVAKGEGDFPLGQRFGRDSKHRSLSSIAIRKIEILGVE